MGIGVGHIVGVDFARPSKCVGRRPQLQLPTASFPPQINYEHWVDGVELFHYAGEGEGADVGEAGEAVARTAVLVEVEHSQQPMTQAQSYGSPLVPLGVEVVVSRGAR